MFKGWPFYDSLEKMIRGTESPKVEDTKTERLDKFMKDIGSRYTFDESILETYDDILDAKKAQEDPIIATAIEKLSQYVSLCRYNKSEKIIDDLDDSLKKVVSTLERHPETIAKIPLEDSDVEKLNEVEKFTREEVLAHADLIKKLESNDQSTSLYNKFAKSLLENSQQPYIDALSISEPFLDAVIKLTIDNDMIVSGSGRRKVMKKPHKK